MYLSSVHCPYNQTIAWKFCKKERRTNQMERWRPWFLSLPACLPASLSKNNKEQRGINERSLNVGHYFGSACRGGRGACACAHLSSQHGVPERRPPKPGPSSPLPQHLVISMSRSMWGSQPCSLSFYSLSLSKGFEKTRDGTLIYHLIQAMMAGPPQGDMANFTGHR